LAIHVELTPEAHGSISDNAREQVAKELQHLIKTLIGVSASIVVKNPFEIERTLVGKVKRVYDNRSK
jgi:phenylacetate-CoA ligase